ncbi:MAG: hypothetical protein EA368_13120 [Leptolyngbya sp. DLM2.Bin27]|nr:MAG: hypothetical protein EA368_13120 [Leptolyngbya sp. DLM2.Bin27]
MQPRQGLGTMPQLRTAVVERFASNIVGNQVGVGKIVAGFELCPEQLVAQPCPLEVVQNSPLKGGKLPKVATKALIGGVDGHPHQTVYPQPKDGVGLAVGQQRQQVAGLPQLARLEVRSQLLL